jgi:hypothetical protein
MEIMRAISHVTSTDVKIIWLVFIAELLDWSNLVCSVFFFLHLLCVGFKSNGTSGNGLFFKMCKSTYINDT